MKIAEQIYKGSMAPLQRRGENSPKLLAVSNIQVSAMQEALCDGGLHILVMVRTGKLRLVDRPRVPQQQKGQASKQASKQRVEEEEEEEEERDGWGCTKKKND